ncbi:MAG: aldehyde dehydrogenase family protein, partial [Actinomycetota bacterium]
MGGRWVAPHGTDVAAVLNPATGDVIGRAAVPSVEDARAAIAAAHTAFHGGPWPRMKPADRAAALRRMAGALRAKKRALIELMIDQVGATVILAKTFQGVWPIDAFELVAGWAESFEWEREVEPGTGVLASRSLLVHEPVGVVTAITPFNFPFFVNAWKVAPAVAMGNTIVLKPAPWTPLDAFE